jgi:hypothetical protein
MTSKLNSSTNYGLHLVHAPYSAHLIILILMCVTSSYVTRILLKIKLCYNLGQLLPMLSDCS